MRNQVHRATLVVSQRLKVVGIHMDLQLAARVRQQQLMRLVVEVDVHNVGFAEAGRRW